MQGSSVVEPKAWLIARPQVDWTAIQEYLGEVGVTGDWWDARAWQDIDPEALVEFAGRMCYRSWEEGLNPNVTRVRTNREAYVRNVLSSLHGSVLEHASFTFAFRHISRVVTHELVRHRAGTAISQESMRFVRLDSIPFWFPDWAREDDELMCRSEELLLALEAHQGWMARHFGLDDEGVPFHEKKHKTSFMRRFAPEGVATDMTWTANVRTLRHVIEMRTTLAAEEEIRLVFSMVARMMTEECPLLFGDFTEIEPDVWMPKWRKV